MEAHLAGEDEEQARRFGWWPKRSGPDDFRRMIAADEREWGTAGSRRRFAARVEGTLVGGCEVRFHGRRAEISYWTFPEFRGRGYAARAARLASAWAFEHGADSVEAHVEVDNHASRRVAEAAGFVSGGRTTEDGLAVYERRRP